LRQKLRPVGNTVCNATSCMFNALKIFLQGQYMFDAFERLKWKTNLIRP
jgi:hypothetical protein